MDKNLYLSKNYKSLITLLLFSPQKSNFKLFDKDRRYFSWLGYMLIDPSRIILPEQHGYHWRVLFTSIIKNFKNIARCRRIYPFPIISWDKDNYTRINSAGTI